MGNGELGRREERGGDEMGGNEMVGSGEKGKGVLGLMYGVKRTRGY